MRSLNFLSLFRDLHKPTRFGVVAEFFRDPLKPTRFGGGGGSSRNVREYRGTHFGQLRQKSRFLAKKLFITQIPSIPGVFFTIPGDLEITPDFWRLPEITGDLAGLVLSV